MSRNYSNLEELFSDNIVRFRMVKRSAPFDWRVQMLATSIQKICAFTGLTFLEGGVGGLPGAQVVWCPKVEIKEVNGRQQAVVSFTLANDEEQGIPDPSPLAIPKGELSEEELNRHFAQLISGQYPLKDPSTDGKYSIITRIVKRLAAAGNLNNKLNN